MRKRANRTRALLERQCTALEEMAREQCALLERQSTAIDEMAREQLAALGVSRAITNDLSGQDLLMLIREARRLLAKAIAER